MNDRQIKLSDVLVDASIRNAMIVHAACGGSTNLLLHVPAIAHAAGLRVPAIEDLVEAGRFASNANLVLLLYSDKLKYYSNDDEPLLNLKYAKNKLSHYRGTDKIRFITRTSQMQEFQDI